MTNDMKTHLDDGEDRLYFVFQHVESAGEFPFNFIEAVFAVRLSTPVC